MARRIVLFGATGHTGERVARALVAAGRRPLLVARNVIRTAALAERLGGLEHAVADARDFETLAGLLEPEAVLVSTVGPFSRWGHAAVQAAVERRATYLDSTGEPAFIRAVFERHGPAASRAGAALLPAMGFDYVPGALAGGLALADAGPDAERVVIGYFVLGPSGTSAGTRRSAAGASLEPSFAYRDGILRTVRVGERARRMLVAGNLRPAVSVGGSEHYALPRIAPALREVEVYAGFFGSAVPAVRLATALLGSSARVPGVSGALRAGLDRLAARGGDPARAGTGESVVVARAYDSGDRGLASVELRGPEPYALTAEILAWAASSSADQRLVRSGAFGAIEAFGLDGLERGCARAGLVRVGGT